VAAAGSGAARRGGDRLGRGGRPAHPGRVGGRAGPARFPLVRAGSGLRGDLPDRVRAQPPTAAAGGRAPGRFRLGDGDHLRRERAVDVGAVRGGAAGRGLLLPAVPAPGPGSGAHRLGTWGIGHRVLLGAGAGPGRGGTGGRHAAGQRGRLRRGRHLRAARGDRAAGSALSPGQGGHQPAAGLGRPPGPAGGAQAGDRPGRAGGIPHPAGQYQARLAQLRRSVRAGRGELAGRLRLPGLRHPGNRQPGALARPAAGLRRGRGGGQHRGHARRVRPGRGDGHRRAGGYRHERVPGADRGAHLPAGQLLADPARRRGHAAGADPAPGAPGAPLSAPLTATGSGVTAPPATSSGTPAGRGSARRSPRPATPG
jgi:hypothetical protein